MEYVEKKSTQKHDKKAPYVEKKQESPYYRVRFESEQIHPKADSHQKFHK